ncbi:hypothetical protein DP43_5571 [Burkholderia pseudomallei]|nr:hypothetical protein DP43_5571 [Burkholderia pseudomallei]
MRADSLSGEPSSTASTTHDAFTSAHASTPGASPSSCTLSCVTTAVIVCSPGNASTTSSFTAPCLTARTLPNSWLRALVFMPILPISFQLTSKPSTAALAASIKRRCSRSIARNAAISAVARGVSVVPPPPLPPVARSTSGSPARLFIVSIASHAPL